MPQIWQTKTERTKRHTIYKCRCHAKRMPGGSTIAGVYQPYGSSDNLIRWGINEHDAGRDPFKVRDEAANFGTVLHRHWECHVKGEPFPAREYPQMYVDIAEKSTARLTEYAQKRGLFVKHSEIQVLCDAHHFGGTIDLIWGLKSNPAEEVLSDLKGSTSVRINHVIQVHGGYRLAYEWEQQNGFRERTQLVDYELLRIDRDSGDLEDHHYTAAEAEAAGRMFLACRDLYADAKLVEVWK